MVVNSDTSSYRSRRCGLTSLTTYRTARADVPLKLLERFSSALFRLRIIFFGVRHGETLIDELARIIFPSHLRINPAELDVMHQPVRIQLDRFFHVPLSFFSGTLRQTTVKHL